MVQARGWCFTINNWTEDELGVLVASDYEYLVYGKERGAAGTPHLQGYIYLKKKTRLGGMKKKYNKRAHWEVAKGSPEQNYEYCTKDGDWEQHGVMPDITGGKKGIKGGEAEQQRWADAKKAAMEGRLDDVPADIYLRYYRTLKTIRDDHTPEPEEAKDTAGIWVYGPAGCGKTRWARDTYKGMYIKPLNKWWDGYDGQRVVLVDDIDPKSGVSRHNLKHWADRYPFNAEYKGGHRLIRPETVIFTSQYSIEQCFEGDQETIDAMKRRCQVKVMGLEPPTIHWSPLLSQPLIQPIHTSNAPPQPMPEAY